MKLNNKPTLKLRFRINNHNTSMNNNIREQL